MESFTATQGLLGYCYIINEITLFTVRVLSTMAVAILHVADRNTKKKKSTCNQMYYVTLRRPHMDILSISYRTVSVIVRPLLKRSITMIF